MNNTLLGVVTELTYKIDTLERFFFVYFVRERVGRHTLSSIFFDGAVSVTLLATLYLMLSFAISLICLVGPDSAVSAAARALLFFVLGVLGFFFLPREPSVIFALNPLCCALVLRFATPDNGDLCVRGDCFDYHLDLPHFPGPLCHLGPHPEGSDCHHAQGRAAVYSICRQNVCDGHWPGRVMNLGVIDAALDALQLLLWRRRNPGKGDIVLLKQDLPSSYPPPLLCPVYCRRLPPR